MNANEKNQSRLKFFKDVIDDCVALGFQRKRICHIDHLKSIIQSANAICIQVKTRRIVFPQLIECWKTLQKDQRNKNEECGHLFNPLGLIPIGETTHSRLLGDLLNPRGTHGQGRRLLHAFLEMIGVPAPESGEWMLSIEEGGVDLCLRRLNPASVIIIENKSNMAIDQPNQLYRYWYEHIHRPYPALDYYSDGVKKAFQIIYLPPTPEKQPAFQSLLRPLYLASVGLPETLNDVGLTIKTCSFRDHIVTWLESCIKIIKITSKDNYRLKAHLQFYQELWT